MFTDVFSLQGGTLRRGEVRTPVWQFKPIQELAIEVFLFKRNFFGLALPGNHLASLPDHLRDSHLKA